MSMNNLVKKYVDSLTKEDIKNFANKEGIEITNNEINIIYSTIKNNIDILLSKDALNFIKRYQSHLSDEVYDKIIEKYNKYKDFINL